jgi:hypothetical protein
MFTAEALRARRRKFENIDSAYSVPLRWIMPFFSVWDSAVLGLVSTKET